MSEKETSILKKVQVALVELGSRLFRNNVGVLLDKNGRPVQFGLCPGSSDLIGWTSLTITPEMVGKKVAVFTSIETKTQEGIVRSNQTRWLSTVVAAGGIGFITKSDAEAVSDMNKIRSIIQLDEGPNA